MNRSRYVPHYPINPYQTQQPYGAVPPNAQMPGMMPTQPLAMPPPGFPPPGMSQSPIQTSLSPNAMWPAPFPNGPIIEDLCAPPHPQMGVPSASPPMPGFPPPRMAMAPMHPGAMPQVQNVYGIPQHHAQHAPLGFAPPPPPQGMHPHLGQGGGMMSMQGMPAARVVGTYPPYTGQQHGYGPLPPGAQGMVDPSGGMLARPRLETGFPAPVVSGVPMGGSPSMGGSPGLEGMPRQPLTPVEEALRGFLSPDLGDLGHP